MFPTDTPVKTTRTSGALTALGCLALIALALWAYDRFFVERTQQEPDIAYQSCNVMGFNIHGNLLTYVPPESLSDDGSAVIEDVIGSEDVVAMIEQAEADPTIQAILLDIDSTGGYPVAAEEIATALLAAKKPTAAVIRQSGLSAAYWVATAADRIFASANSDVGSIGVTMSYLRNINEAGQYVELSSGKFKDAGDPDKPITAEERELFLRDVKITHQNFVSAVAANRKLPLEMVAALADGSSVLGGRAKEIGLIDEIGGWNEAKAYLAERINSGVIEVCWQ